MILDTIDHWENNRNQYGPAVQRALEFVRGLNVSEMPDRVEIDGVNMFVMKQSPATARLEERKAEVHRQYADIHLVLEGEEWQAFALAGGNASDLVQDKIEESDFAIYGKLEQEHRVLLTKGMFTVYWPGEYHRPNMHPDGDSRLLKLVVKIHRDLFHVF